LFLAFSWGVYRLRVNDQGCKTSFLKLRMRDPDFDGSLLRFGADDIPATARIAPDRSSMTSTPR